MVQTQLQDDRQNHAHLLQLAYQGDAKAIAMLMNRHLKRQKMVTQAGWRGNCLHVLIEAMQPPSPEPLMSSIHRTVLRLNLSRLNRLKVSCRQIGTSQFVWSQERTIAPTLTAVNSQSQAPLTTSISLADWLNQKPQADLSALLQPISTAATEPGELRFLRFSVSSAETALLPLISIRQVMKVMPHSILPVPDMPSSVLGIYNFRGEMLWLVDLGLQIGFQGVRTLQGNLLAQSAGAQTTAASTAKPLSGLGQFLGWTAIVIQAQDKSLGLVVPEVIDIESYALGQLQPPAIDLFPSTVLPFIQGYLVRSSSPVLDANALIADSCLQIHAA
ncbi:MAG: chemotaxis protein CheW [Oscillatoriophycideae cyanobacterium NC_groundwater_1537_Pr4_S-0.65um_50_18]|nr:chemotaxis protein CheW [Oscillatoriophycideae cyanobacterium NC_groundwater_1537_Pr4_S-0.65um_50_18]